MALQWVSVDLLTSRILAYLPDLEAKQALRRTIGQYDSASLTLHVTESLPPDWERAILPGASALLAFSGPPGQEVVEWGGMVLQAPKTLGSDIELSVVTVEAYFDRCYVGTDGDYRPRQVDQNEIATTMVSRFAGNAERIPFEYEVVGDAGELRDRNYRNFQNKTVYSALQELMGVLGGPEWTVEWRWDHDANLIRPVFRVGTRLGTAARHGRPAVTFDGASLIDAEVGFDYSAESGANLVSATAGGQGKDSPRASTRAVTADLNGRPLMEYRWSPSETITDFWTLYYHALSALGFMSDGAHPASLTVRRDLPGQVLGVDWHLGDDIGYDITSPSMPNGASGVVRCVGYEVTADTVAPILKQDSAS